MIVPGLLTMFSMTCGTRGAAVGAAPLRPASPPWNHGVRGGHAILVALSVGGFAWPAESGPAAAHPSGDGDRQAAAFAAFERLPASIDLPTGDPADPFAVVALSRRGRQVDLGPVPLKDLVGLSFRLAVPEETTAGQPFRAEIVAVNQGLGGPRWEIRQLVGRPPLGEPPGPITLATLAEHDGRMIVEVERTQLGSRGLAILRRCVILAEAVDPRTKLPVAREIRLVKPAKVRAFVVDARNGIQTIAIPVPGGIASQDTSGGDTVENLALPVRSIQLEGRWGDHPVTMRWPRPEGGGQRPGVGSWTVALANLDEGVELGLTVTVSLAGATLECVPYLAEKTGKLVAQDELARHLQGRHGSLDRIETQFRARVKLCPLWDYRRSRGDHGRSDFVGSWFDTPLATEQAMTLELPGHETVRSSVDLYLREEWQRAAQELTEAWKKKLAAMPDGNARKREEYFGPPRPPLPRDFADWQSQWRGARESEWEALFQGRLTAWSEWFWRRFEARWRRHWAGVGEALEKTVEIRILEIRSLARDALGNEYPVPLVVSPPVFAAADLGGPPAPASPAAGKKEGRPPRVGDATNGLD